MIVAVRLEENAAEKMRLSKEGDGWRQHSGGRQDNTGKLQKLHIVNAVSPSALPGGRPEEQGALTEDGRRAHSYGRVALARHRARRNRATWRSVDSRSPGVAWRTTGLSVSCIVWPSLRLGSTC